MTQAAELAMREHKQLVRRQKAETEELMAEWREKDIPLTQRLAEFSELCQRHCREHEEFVQWEKKYVGEYA